MTPQFVDPFTHAPLAPVDDALQSKDGVRYPVVNGIPRFCELENYTSNFGKQWNLFQETQIDSATAVDASTRRLFDETKWKPDDLEGANILEVGSGAGRFSRAILEHTGANLFSVDYSNAVEANLRNNAEIGRGRFWLAQASIYEMPFRDNEFDKVLCLGVLQHTPDFELSVKALIAKARPGREIVVDFYPIRGWWTKLHAKYLLRPLTKRMSHDRLLKLIDANLDWMIGLSQILQRARLGVLSRFIPIADLRILPADLARDRRREWELLDTFDMFSPEHDHPQRVETVAKMFDRYGADVTFSGYLNNQSRTAVVRGIKRNLS